MSSWSRSVANQTLEIALSPSDLGFQGLPMGTWDLGLGHFEAIFVMSKSLVTFHQFASLFKDYLGVPQALYFDGNVSRLFAPILNRNDPGRKMGPIIAAVRSKP